MVTYLKREKVYNFQMSVSESVIHLYLVLGSKVNLPCNRKQLLSYIELKPSQGEDVMLLTLHYWLLLTLC